MPWVILLAARPSTSTLYSDCPSMSMKPGATTSREASMRRFDARAPSAPTASMRSPTTQTSARNQGAPVPSTTRPPARSRSQAGGAGGVGGAASRDSCRIAISMAPDYATDRRRLRFDLSCPPEGDAMNHRRMGATGLKVSELCLGTMTFGVQCDESLSFAILDRAADRGVDFLDTADC